MYDKRDAIDFGKTDIPQLFRSVFIPTLLGMMFNMAFVLTDGIFVGHGIGDDGLACINLAAPIMMFVTGAGMMFGIGSSVVGAIHLAQDNKKAARIIATQAYLASLVFAAVVAAVFYLFPNGTLSLLGVSDTLMAMAKEYYLWFIPTCIFLMFQIVGEFIIRLDGAPRYAMYANIIPALINIVLDYIFIFPCGMGLKGAALATDIGTGIGALMALYYMLFRAQHLRFYRLKRTWTSLRLTLRNVGYMMKMGFSAFVGELAISVMILTGNISFGRLLGDGGIAAFSVICYLFPVVYMIYNAAAQSAQPIISYNHGATQPQRVNKTFRYSVIICIAFGLVATLLFAFFAPTVIGIFLDTTTKAYPIATKGLPLFASGFVFVAFNVSAIGYFQSIERANFATLLMVLRGIVLLIAAFLLLPRWWGASGLWLAVPCAEVITFFIILAWFVKKK